MAGSAIPASSAGHPSRSATTDHALTLIPDHLVGAGQTSCGGDRNKFRPRRCRRDRQSDAVAARRFLRKTLKPPHTVNPRTITVDKNAAYPTAMNTMQQGGEHWRCAKLRQVKHLNNIVEQDHRRIKRLVRLALGFKSFTSASRTIAGYEAMAMIRKGQVVIASANDMVAQRDFIATLFGAAA